MSEQCKCGHPKSAHIYDEGACRPGFFCCVQCEKYTSPIQKDPFLSRAREIMETLGIDHGAETFVTDGYAYFDDAIERIASALRTEAAKSEALRAWISDIHHAVLWSGSNDWTPPEAEGRKNIIKVARASMKALSSNPARSDAMEGLSGVDAKSLGACPPHAWSRDGERCTKCGDKDWM